MSINELLWDCKLQQWKLLPGRQDFIAWNLKYTGSKCEQSLECFGCGIPGSLCFRLFELETNDEELLSCHNIEKPSKDQSLPRARTHGSCGSCGSSTWIPTKSLCRCDHNTSLPSSLMRIAHRRLRGFRRSGATPCGLSARGKKRAEFSFPTSKRCGMVVGFVHALNRKRCKPGYSVHFSLGSWSGTANVVLKDLGLASPCRLRGIMPSIALCVSMNHGVIKSNLCALPTPQQLTWKRANPKFYEGNFLSSSVLISPEEYPSKKKNCINSITISVNFGPFLRRVSRPTVQCRTSGNCPSSCTLVWADLFSELFTQNWIVWEILKLISESWILEMTSSSE